MADVQLMQARDASQQLFQILVIDAMARIHLDAQSISFFSLELFCNIHSSCSFSL